MDLDGGHYGESRVRMEGQKERGGDFFQAATSSVGKSVREGRYGCGQAAPLVPL
jgi:hypothetical protein